MARKNMKKSNKSKPVRKVEVSVSKVIRKTLSPMTTTVRQICTDNIDVTSVSGVPDIVFRTSAGNQPFYNLKMLGGLADYGETSNYEFCKVHSIIFEFTRS